MKEKSAAPASSIGNYNKLCGDGCGDVPLAIASELPQHQGNLINPDSIGIFQMNCVISSVISNA